jgi:hypothetical protein
MPVFRSVVSVLVSTVPLSVRLTVIGYIRVWVLCLSLL